MATAIEDRVRVDEHNGVLHAYCPNCSRMYPTEDFRGMQEINGVMTRITEPVDVPSMCKRCGCPMDLELQPAFAEEQAAGYGKGLRRPGWDTQVKGGAVTK